MQHAEWAAFNKAFVEHLNKEISSDERKPETEWLFPNKTHIFFAGKRMGQNILLKDSLALFQENDVPFKMYSIFDEKEIISLATHICTDMTTEENNMLMWELEEVRRRFTIMGQGIAYHVFYLPGLGNITYQLSWKHLPVTGSMPKFLQLYHRCGHEVHRDKFGFFKFPFVAERLVELNGAVLREEKERNLSAKDNAMLSMDFFRPIDAIIKQVLRQTATRCEVVWETTEFKLGIPHQMCIAYELAQDWIYQFELSSSRFLRSVPRCTLHSILQFILEPCKMVMRKAILDVQENVGGFQADGEEIKPAFSDPREVIRLICAEAMVAMLLRGNVNKWPRYVERSLYLDYIKICPREDPCQITYLLFGTTIHCHIRPIDVCTKIPGWLLGSGREFEAYLKLVKMLSELKEEIKVKEVVQQLLNLLISVCSIKRNKSSLLTGSQENYRKLRPSSNLKPGRGETRRSVMFTKDFLANCLFSTSKTKLQPVALLQLAKALKHSMEYRSERKENLKIYEILENEMEYRSESLKENLNLSEIMEDEISEQVVKFEVPLYLKLNAREFVAVLPSNVKPSNLKSLAKAFKDAYVWHFQIATEDTMQDINLFQKTLQVLQNEIDMWNAKSYFNLIHASLGEKEARKRTRQELQQIMYPLTVTSEMFDALIETGFAFPEDGAPYEIL